MRMQTTPESAATLSRIRWLVAFFIAGLVLSGATAIPIRTEIQFLANVTGVNSVLDSTPTESAPSWAVWLGKLQSWAIETGENYPFVGYAGDWLAFGHFVIAIAFIGAWRDPLQNRWLFDFGLIACALVIPYALVAGGFRGIPVWWRLIDLSFGLLGAIPLWFARRMTLRLVATGPQP